jgi:amidase
MNCLTETFFEQALERARYLDYMHGKGKLVGPLHGLPVSLKDTYQVEGTQATVGAVAYLDRTSKENSSLVDILLGLGAVLYVKTNVSQALLVGFNGALILGKIPDESTDRGVRQ